MSTQPRGKAGATSAARRSPVSSLPQRRLPRASRKRVVILSRKKTLYSTRRLIEAVRAQGHEARVIDTLACDLLVQRGEPGLFYDGAPLERPDLVIPRIGASITSYGLAVVNQLEAMGIPVLNEAAAIARSRDKLRCLQLLAREGLDIPRTVLMRQRDHLEEAVAQIGGLPVIVKLLRGTQGVGVMLAHSEEELASTLDTLWTLHQELLLQEFIGESRGRDIRVFVVGDRVVGAMRREAKVEGEFRSNIHRGGSGKAVHLDPAYERAALRAARVLGLDVAGVDLLEASSGPKVAEVNSSPGLQGIERTLGIDVAGQIVAHGIERALSGATAGTSAFR